MESQLIQKSFGAKKTKEPKQIIMIIISSKYNVYYICKLIQYCPIGQC